MRMRPGSHRLALAAAITAAIAAFAGSVPRAARAQPATLADIAAYAAADRTQRLVEGARREGALTLYSSAPTEDMTAITSAFERKYGVKVRLWRGGSEEILNRAVAEHRGGRSGVDVAETAGPELETLAREGLLQEIRSPVLADLIPLAVEPHRAWIVSRLSIFAALYNTNLVKADEVPASYQDLLDARWKGRLGIEADDTAWFLTVVGAMGEDKGLALFRDIVARNGISVRKGHSLLANLVIAGEVPLALTVYSYRARELKKAGAPVGLTYLPPAVAQPTGIGVFRAAPHPFAAVLFFDFILTDGQRIFVERESFPTNRTVSELPQGLDMTLIDIAKFLDQRDRWTALFRQTFVSPTR